MPDPNINDGGFVGKDMTVRQLFAGMALVGFLANGDHVAEYNKELIAHKCYEFADALIKESEFER